MKVSVMRLKITPRQTHSRLMSWLTPVMALGLSLVSGMIMFYLLGYPPIESLYTFFISPISDLYGVSELIVKASPLAIIAIGLAMGFKANVWNIGAEGQFTIGAITGSALVIYFPESENFLMLPAMLILGIVGGMAWASIPAILKTRFNTNEILTSLLLVYVAILLLSTLIHGPWRDPGGYNFPESVVFPDVATLPSILSGTRLHAGTLIALLVVATAWVLYSKTIAGFQVRVAGLAPNAARYAGVQYKRMIWYVLLAAGGLSGLAGIIEVTGLIGQLQPIVSPGYGFSAIIVAFLGRLHPIGIVFASLVLALSYLGGEFVQIKLGLPLGIAGVFQGMLLFFLLSCDLLINYRVEIRHTKPIAPEKAS